MKKINISLPMFYIELEVANKFEHHIMSSEFQQELCDFMDKWGIFSFVKVERSRFGYSLSKEQMDQYLLDYQKEFEETISKL